MFENIDSICQNPKAKQWVSELIVKKYESKSDELLNVFEESKVLSFKKLLGNQNIEKLFALKAKQTDKQVGSILIDPHITLYI
jgi:hypothetical protein